MHALDFAHLNSATDKACGLASPEGVQLPGAGLLTLAQVRRAAQAIRPALLVGNRSTAVALAGRALPDCSQHQPTAPLQRTAEAEAFVAWVVGLALSAAPPRPAAPARRVVTELALDSIRVTACGTPFSSTVTRSEWCSQPA